MELQRLKELIVKFLQQEPLTDEEGRQLLAGMDSLIEKNEAHLLLGLAYHTGREHVLCAADLQRLYWEIEMYYGDHEDDHDHFHDGELPPAKAGFLHKWGWWCALLTGALSGVAYVLVRKLLS